MGKQRQDHVLVDELEYLVQPRSYTDQKLIYELGRKRGISVPYCCAAAGWAVHPHEPFDLIRWRKLQRYLRAEFPHGWVDQQKEAWVEMLQSARFREQQMDARRADQAEIDRVRREIYADPAATKKK